MKRFAWVALLALPGPAGAQFPTPQFPSRGDRGRLTPPETRDADQLRAERDLLVNKLGPAAGPFCRKFGTQGIDALRRLSTAAGQRLIASSAQLEQVPDPGRLLQAVAGTGDEVCAYAVAHLKDLSDPAAFEAFLGEPKSFAYELKSLDDAAAEARAVAGRRAAGPFDGIGVTAFDGGFGGNGTAGWLGVGLIVATVGVFIGRAIGQRSKARP
jgi:hypothetical protein